MISVVWRDSVNAPHGGIELTMRANIASPTHGAKIPRPGDWIVIRRTDSEAAYAFGRVHDASGGIDNNAASGRVAMPFKVYAESWFDFLARVQVYAGPGVSTPVGTLLSSDEIQNVFEAAKTAFRGDIGKALGEVIGYVANVLIGSSQGAFISDEIKVIHSPDTSRLYGRGDRTAEAVIGPAVNSIGAVSSVMTGTTVLGLIQSTFGADAGMIEMFPSLERFGGGSDPTTTGNTPFELGKSIALVYRMRPWREVPLPEYVSKLGTTSTKFLRP